MTVSVSMPMGLLRKGIETQPLVGAIHELPPQNDNKHVVQQTATRV